MAALDILKMKQAFSKSFGKKTHLLRAYYLGFEWSGWIVLIDSEILITTKTVGSVSNDEWKAPLVNTGLTV